MAAGFKRLGLRYDRTTHNAPLLTLVFPGKRYLDWQLADPAGKGLDAVRPIRDEIDIRVHSPNSPSTPLPAVSPG